MRKEVEEIILRHEQEANRRELEKRALVARHFNLMEGGKKYFEGDSPYWASQMGFSNEEIAPDGTKRFYKVDSDTPLKLTDDEYAALLNIWDPEAEKGKKPADIEVKNGTPVRQEWETTIGTSAYSESIMAKVLMGVAAGTWVVGLILAIVMGNIASIYPGEFNAVAFWITIGFSFVSGLLFAAFSILIQHVSSIDCAIINGAKAVTVAKEKNQTGRK